MMTFQEAKDLAIEFGAKTPKFDHTHPAAQCWIDRIALLKMMADRGASFGDYINDANRYTGKGA
jgi:hypothetical protein